MPVATAGVLALALLVASASASAQQPAPTVAGGAAAGGWVLDTDMSDDFDAGLAGLAGTSKWTESLHGWRGLAPGVFEPGMSSVANGSLGLGAAAPTAVAAAAATDDDCGCGAGATVATGMVASASKAKHGFFEIEARMAPASLLSAFWLQGASGEINAFEAVPAPAAPGQPPVARTNYHCFAGATTPADVMSSEASVLGALPDGFDPADDFHVYGLDWSAAGLKFYVDGVLVREVAAADAAAGCFEQPMNVILSLEVIDHFGVPDAAALAGSPRTAIRYFRRWVAGAGAGADDVGAAADDAGAGADDAGAGVDDVGAGVDDVGAANMTLAPPPAAPTTQAPQAQRLTVELPGVDLAAMEEGEQEALVTAVKAMLAAESGGLLVAGDVAAVAFVPATDGRQSVAAVAELVPTVTADMAAGTVSSLNTAVDAGQLSVQVTQSGQTSTVQITQPAAASTTGDAGGGGGDGDGDDDDTGAADGSGASGTTPTAAIIGAGVLAVVLLLAAAGHRVRSKGRAPVVRSVEEGGAGAPRPLPRRPSAEIEAVDYREIRGSMTHYVVPPAAQPPARVPARRSSPPAAVVEVTMVREHVLPATEQQRCRLSDGSIVSVPTHRSSDASVTSLDRLAGLPGTLSATGSLGSNSSNLQLDADGSSIRLQSVRRANPLAAGR